MSAYSSRLSKARILVIDDANFSIHLVTFALTKAGYHNIETARDGEEGLRKTISFQPDLVILDLKMPKIDGFSYCARVRSERGYPGMPIIVQTMLGEREVKLRALSCGADDFLNKPFDQEEFALRVRLHLERYFQMQDMNELCSYMQMELEQAETLMKQLQQSQMPAEALKILGRHFEVIHTMALLSATNDR